jgi:ubiquinone biosynthesis protein
MTISETREVSENKRGVTPEYARRFLERLGPIYVRIGKHLALRPDLIDQGFCEEFLTLTDQTDPLDFNSVAQIINTELGVSWQAAWSWISPGPIYSGPLTQTHRARATNGDEVTIKVQRPDAAATVQTALGSAKVIERIATMTGADLAISTSELVDDLKRGMLDELDFVVELRNLTRLFKLAPEDQRSQIPRAYPHLSGAGVLTIEFLAGVPMTEVLRQAREGRSGTMKSLRIQSVDLADNVLHSALDEIFRLEFFEINTHPTNVLVMPANEIGFADFALMKVVEPELRLGMMRLLRAISTDDAAGIFDGFTELLISGQYSDLNRLRVEFYNYIEGAERRQRRQLTEGSRVPLCLRAILRTAPENGFRVPTAMRWFCRRLLNSQMIAEQLSEGANLSNSAKPLYERMQVRQLIDAFRLDSLQPVVLDSLNLISEGPRTVRRLLADQVEGRLVLRVRTLESDDDRKRANARARLVTTGTVSIGVAFLIGATRGATVFGTFPLSWLLAPLLVLTWIWVLVQWRKLQ